MDGELNPLLAPSSERDDAVVRERITAATPVARRPRTLRWLVIVGLLLAVVLGGFYGFNRYRSQAIATFFANNKPPPAAALPHPACSYHRLHRRQPMLRATCR